MTSTDEPYVDPGHRVPDDQWAEIVRRAQEFRAEHEANKTGGAAPIAGPIVDMTAEGRASGKYFGVSGIPTQLGVLHSGECPLRGGYARSLTLWAATPLSQGGPQASWHHFIDPISWVKFVPPELGAWHASEANSMSEGFEQAGYARFSRSEWLTPDGLLQLNTLAFAMADFARRNNIPPVWLTTDQVTAVTTHGDRTTRGFCLHRQIDPETRTDPGDSYPYELLMATIKQFLGSGLNYQSTITTVTEEGFLMALSDQDQIEVRDNLRKLVHATEAERDFDQKVNEKVDELVGNSRKTFWNSEESKIRLQSAPPSQIAADINAAGIAADVRDELVKLLGGSK